MNVSVAVATIALLSFQPLLVLILDNSAVNDITGTRCSFLSEERYIELCRYESFSELSLGC